MLACGVREVARRPLSRRPLYSGTEASRLRSRPHRFAALAALLSAFSTAGCAYQLDTAFSKTDADVEQTGSIGRPDRQVTAANVVAPSETDLAYARAVAADVVGHGAKDASIPWENPNTGAGGNITAARRFLQRGLSDLPRFFGELCARAGAGLVAGRSLPLGARQMGSQEPAAVQTGLSEPAFSAPPLIQWIAGRFLKSHINESNSIGRRGWPEKPNGVHGGCVIPMRCWV